MNVILMTSSFSPTINGFKAMANQMDGWDVKANRLVALIDIMGFKDMVARSPHEQIYDMMLNVNKNIQKSVGIKWTNTSQGLVNTTSYSDSIMLYSKNSNLDSFNAFANSVALLTNDLLSDCIPHKGSIAFGEMTLDIKNSIFFGQPLIDAFLLQEELKFYGIVLHASAEQALKPYTERLKINFVETYRCFFKQGEASNMVIYPMYAKNMKGKFPDQIKKLQESINGLRHKTSGHLRSFIDNTEAYLSYLRKM